MLKIDEKELLLNKNAGFVGDFKYEKIFNRSLSDDLIQTIRDGISIRFDRLVFFRLCYLMSGYIDNISFEEFLIKIPKDYNFINDFVEVLEKARQTYLPIESSSEEENQS